MAKRYDQMLKIVADVRPSTIVEIGVHRAMRASKLCREALRYSEKVNYIGFDVFETMEEDFHEAALNGKGMPTESAARQRLDQIRDLNYEFVIGDTRNTLHGKRLNADFAFIDGDHRVDAIRGDYEALADCRCVVFDDYYRAGSDGVIPDTLLFGANAVVDELIATGRNVEILPHGDACKHGGQSYLAVVWK